MNDAKQSLTAEEQSIIDRVEAYRKNHPLQCHLAYQDGLHRLENLFHADRAHADIVAASAVAVIAGADAR
jgi:RNase adaptor protein for sRNA GlmZ degradation